MNIATIAWADTTSTSLRVTTDDGGVHFVPWPCETWHRDLIEAWLASGGQIGPFEPPPPPPQMTPLQFFDLFTEAEEMAIFAERQTDPMVDRWLTRAAAASYIDLNDPRTAAGIGYLKSRGLLSLERADAILAGQGPVS